MNSTPFALLAVDGPHGERVTLRVSVASTMADVTEQLHERTGVRLRLRPQHSEGADSATPPELFCGAAPVAADTVVLDQFAAALAALPTLPAPAAGNIPAGASSVGSDYDEGKGGSQGGYEDTTRPREPLSLLDVTLTLRTTRSLRPPHSAGTSAGPSRTSCLSPSPSPILSPCPARHRMHVLLFPGQGVQQPGMGVAACFGPHGSAAARALFALASRRLGYDLLALCRQGPAEALRPTLVQQPAWPTAGLRLAGGMASSPSRSWSASVSA